MSQTVQRDIEGGSNSGPVDGHRDQPPSNSIQPTQNQPSQPRRGQSDYDNGSWPIYSMYSKITADDDNKIVEICQKDADGTLIFTGLFSATLGALLTVTIPDLKPNSQDTSAFYLKQIYQYQILGDSNVSQSSISSSLATPPAFSPPRYALWVNSLYSLSLAISLTSAVYALIHQNMVAHYLSITRRSSYTPTKRARIHAIFAGEVANFRLEPSVNYIFLHLSLLLFIIGTLIYIFSINRAIFYAVIWLIALATMDYAVATGEMFLRRPILTHTPFSILALRIYLGTSYAMFRTRSRISSLFGRHNNARWCHRDLSDRYRDGFTMGRVTEAVAIALEPSSKTDSTILERILLTLHDDHALEAFFDAIPGFCNSKLAALPLSYQVQSKLREKLDIFLDLTFSSTSVSESVRARRLTTCLNAAHAALGPYEVSRILDNILNGHWDEALQSVEIGLALRLWGHSRDHNREVRRIVACIISHVEEHDDRWILLVKETFGVPDRVFRDYLAHGDSVLLSILINVSHEARHASPFTSGILSSLSRFDIHNTLPGLQHEFCTLWNDIAQEARNQGRFSTFVKMLDEIHHLYIALHQNAHTTPKPSSTSTDSLDQGTNANRIPFSTSTDSSDFIPPYHPWHLLCNVASHRPDSTTPYPVAKSETVPLPTLPGDSPDASPHQSTLKYYTALRQPDEANIITGLPSPPDPSTASEIGDSSHTFTATFPIHSCSPSLDRAPQDDVVTAQPNATTANLSYTLESDGQQGPALGLATSYAALPAENSATPLRPAAPPPESTSPVPNNSSTTYDASPTFITTSSLPALSSGFPAPDPYSSPPVPSFPNAELLSLRSGMSQDPSDNATLSRLHSRRLANNWDMLANAVLQLLVYCPPFRDLLKDTRLVGQREGGMSGGIATLLMDASVRFDEFAYKEKSSVAHRFLQQAGGSKVRADEDGKKEDGGVHSFLSTDIFDAMKEKRQFVIMKDDLQQDAVVFFGVYLDALDEELVTIRSSIGTHRRASILKVEELEEEGQPGDRQTEMRERDYMASSVESPISRIFGGRFRSILRMPNQPDVVTVEDWRSLKLNIQPNSVHSILDALTHISQPQPVEVEVGQSGLSEANQQLFLEALPSILVLHLERFLYDAATDSLNKISKFVQFAHELEIPLEIMAPVSGTSAEPVLYKLHGVLYHHGKSASSGHYTVDVLHRNGDSNGGEAWLHIDEAVSAVQHEDVFWNHANEPEDDRCAYMLFYCRTAPARA